MSHDRWGNILKPTRFPIPLLIPNASIFHHWHDLAWLHPMTDMCVPSDMTHTAWIAGTNRIPHQPSHHSKLLWRSRFQNLIWHHSSNQKQIDMVMIWTTQSLLDDPLTSASSSSSSESGRGTWMQKRPLMQKQTFPSPHIMFQWRIIFVMWNKNEYSIFWQKEFWNQEMFSFQLPKVRMTHHFSSPLMEGTTVQ